MQEIWLMQPRFALRQRKRVFRTLAHPRFRAAFDFLELRQEAAPELSEDVDFWREAQGLPQEALAERLSSAPDGKASAGAPKRRRRRRRRDASGSGAGDQQE
jgi:poly(A) polymerase